MLPQIGEELLLHVNLGLDLEILDQVLQLAHQRDLHIVT